MEQIDEAQAAVGQAAEHVERVAHMDADIGEMLVANAAERGGDAVEERLAADEAMIGQQVGAVGEMLARAEADFQVERAVVAEQAPRGQLAIVGDRDRGKQHFDQRRLRRAQLVPARAAVEAVDGGGVGAMVIGLRG